MSDDAVPQASEQQWQSDRERLEGQANKGELAIADALRTRLGELGHHELAPRRALLLDLAVNVIGPHLSRPDGLGVTGNAQLLLGYIAGAMSLVDDPDYEFVTVEAAQGQQTVRHRASRNTYRISVVQLEGSV